MRGLRDQRVLITGGASGIGAATAERFLEEEARVAILDRDGAACAGFVDAHPQVELSLAADVTDPDAVTEAFRAIDTAWEGIDTLINNAGISVRHPFLEIDFADWRRVVDTNLHGIFLVAQAAAGRMREQGRGVILHTASTNGLQGYARYADYNACKAGVIALTRTMALELAPAVRVNAVCPGYVMTPMQRAEYTDEMIDAVNSAIPLGRHADPEEVAGLFAFLASDDAGYITGQTVVIDGGETAGRFTR